VSICPQIVWGRKIYVPKSFLPKDFQVDRLTLKNEETDENSRRDNKFGDIKSKGHFFQVPQKRGDKM
jgi:hypothetical protein